MRGGGVGRDGRPRGPGGPRAYRLLLRLLPREFRREFGDEIAALFARRLASVRGVARAAVWVHGIADVMRAAAAERVRGRARARAAHDRRASAWTGLGGDLRYVARVLARSPAFTMTAVLSLGIGIGANAAIFGAIGRVLRAPLAVERPEQLAVVYWHSAGDVGISQINSGSYTDPGSGLSHRTNFSYPLYRALRDASTDASVFAFTFVRGLSIGADESPPVVGGGLLADGRTFGVLRPGMALGRPLLEGDDRPDAPLVVVLDHAFWQRAFGGSADIIGRSVRINGVAAEVVGVTAASFRGLSAGGFFPRTDVMLPLSAQPLVAAAWSRDGASLFTAGDVFWLRVMARVPRRDALPTVTAALTTAFRSVDSPVTTLDSPPATLLLAPGQRGPEPIGAETARTLWLLWGVVGAVLLIACVNLASLMLARGVAREREMAVRRALGGGRARLVRQTLLEGLVLSAAGAITGIALVHTARGALDAFLTRGFGLSAFGASAVEAAVDVRVLALCAALCIGATLLFTLLPALRLSGLDPAASLRHRGAGAAPPRLALGRALIAVQISISIPLVVAAGLLLRTLSNLNATELGFDPRGVLIFRVDPAYARIPADSQPALYLTLLRELRSIPGVRSATLIENALMSGLTSNRRVTVDGREHNLFMNAVGPDFVDVMRMRLVAGRMPGEHDGPHRPLVAAVNETAVRTVFGGASPIGRTITAGGSELTIVGVVADSRYERQRADVRPTLFDAALQRPGYGGHNIMLRTDHPIGQLEGEIRRAVAAVDRDLPVPDIRSQLDQIARSTARERALTQLFALFGAFALLLAAIGVHGVTSYAVSRRTSEIGVRVALGARPAQVLWLVLRGVALLAAAGLALGIPAALALGPIVRSVLFGVAPSDVATIAGAALVMLTVAFAAGALPARRASRVHPLEALRTE